MEANKNATTMRLLSNSPTATTKATAASIATTNAGGAASPVATKPSTTAKQMLTTPAPSRMIAAATTASVVIPPTAACNPPPIPPVPCAGVAHAAPPPPSRVSAVAATTANPTHPVMMPHAQGGGARPATHPIPPTGGGVTTCQVPPAVLIAFRGILTTFSNEDFFLEFERERQRRYRMGKLKRPAPRPQENPAAAKRAKSTAAPQNASVLTAALAFVGPTATPAAPREQPEDAHWLRMYNEVVRYKAEHGDCQVVPSKNQALYDWLSTQYSNWKSFRNDPTTCTYPIARIQKLVDLGLGTMKDGPYAESASIPAPPAAVAVAVAPTPIAQAPPKPSAPAQKGSVLAAATSIPPPTAQPARKPLTLPEDPNWLRMYNELVAYKAEHGNCQVPSKNQPLYGWVARQRHKWKSFRNDPTTCQYPTARIQKLVELGLGTLADGPHAKVASTPAPAVAAPPRVPQETVPSPTWLRMYNQLVAYKAEHGNCQVPSKNQPLYGWLSRQRIQWKTFRQFPATTSTFSVARIEKLVELGVGTMEDGPYASLAYVAPAPTGNTPAAPIAQTLETPEDPQWLLMYNRLVAHKEEHGSCNVPSKSQPLYGWLAKQRNKWRASRNNPESRYPMSRIHKLVELGLGTVKDGPHANLTYVNRWDNMYKEMVAFKNKYGHCNVIVHAKEYDALNKWTRTQRVAFASRQEFAATGIKGRKCILTDDRLNKLAAIGFTFKKMHTFEERLEQIINYKAEHGDTRVPVAFKGYDNLGRWVTGIKCEYWNNKLSEARIAKLNAVDFDWSLRSNPLNRPRENGPRNFTGSAAHLDFSL